MKLRKAVKLCGFLEFESKVDVGNLCAATYSSKLYPCSGCGSSTRMKVAIWGTGLV
jgi:hypothetical protein